MVPGKHLHASPYQGLSVITITLTRCQLFSKVLQPLTDAKPSYRLAEPNQPETGREAVEYRARSKGTDNLIVAEQDNREIRCPGRHGFRDFIDHMGIDCSHCRIDHFDSFPGQSLGQHGFQQAPKTEIRVRESPCSGFTQDKYADKIPGPDFRKRILKRCSI